MMRLEAIYYILKIFGLLCIIVGCAGIGILKAKELGSRIDLLREWKKVLLELQNEIRFLSAPIPEIFEKISEQCHGSNRWFFEYICGILKERAGESVDKIWEKAAELFLSETALKKSDIGLINEIGSRIGCSDKKAQLSMLELYIEQIDLRVKDLSLQISKKKRVYECLGLFSGLIIALCLV